jgi:hypothetical protein
MKVTALLVLMVFLPLAAHAEDDTPLAKDDPAPFTGVLIPSDNYARVIKDRAELDKLKIKSETEEKLESFKEQKNKELMDLKQQETEAWKKQAEKNAERSFLEQHGFQIGVAVGVVLTIAAAFAAAQAIKSR